MSEENKVGFELDVDTRGAQNKLNELGGLIRQVFIDPLTKNSSAFSGKNQIVKLLKEVANTDVSRTTRKYKELMDMFANTDTSKAETAFSKISGYMNSANLITEAFIKTASKVSKIDFSAMNKLNIDTFINQLNRMQGADTTALTKFKSLSDSMNALTSGFKRLNEIEMSDASNNKLAVKMKQITEMVAQFTAAFENVKTEGVSAIVKALTELPKAMQSMEKLDHSKVGQSFDTLTQKLHKFLAELRESSSEIHAFSNIVSTLGKGANTNPLTSGLRNVQREIRNTGTESDRTNRKLSNMLSFGKLYAFYNQLRHFGSGFANMLNKSIDFTEIENYFSRAMGNMRSEAMKFQNQLSDMYGLAMPSMMQAQATFKNQLGALGDLSENMSYMLSERLTKMSLDYASLYNVSVDSAVTKFQAALSKQVRPIRSQSGYDITQSVLGGTLQNIGIYDKQIRDLSEIEKRLVIILTLQQQMARSAAMGDFARTIEQPANQLKILQQQIAEVGRWISAVFYGVIGKVLPYINGFVMAIKSLIQMFASFLGYELPDSSGATGSILDGMDESLGGVSDGLDDVNSGLDDANSGLDSAKKKTKEWKNFLAGFDVANVIPDQNTDDSSSGSGGGGSSGAGSMSIDPRLLKALQDMDYLFDSIRMKAMDIRDQLLEWANILGKVVDDNIFEPIRNSWNKYGAGILKNITETKDNIVHILGGVFDVVAQKWKPFFQAASDLFFSLLETITSISNGISKVLRYAWDYGGKYLFESLWDFATAVAKIATKINNTFIKPVIKWFNKYLAKEVGRAIGAVLKTLGQFVKIASDFISWLSKDGNPTLKIFAVIWSTIKISSLVTQFKQYNQYVRTATALTGVATNNFGVFGKAIGAVIQFFDRLLHEGFSSAIQIFPKLNSAWTVATTFVGKFGNSLGTLVTSIAGVVGNHLPALGNMLGKVGGWLSSASFGPWALGIGAAVTAIMILINWLNSFGKEEDYTNVKIEDCSKTVQDQAKAIEELADNMKQANETYAKSLNEADASANTIKKNLSDLLKMAGKTKIIDEKNLTRANVYVDEINKALGTQIEISKEGKLILHNTNGELEDMIENMRERAKEEARYQLMVEAEKSQIEIQAKIATAKESLNNLRSKETDLINQQMQLESALSELRANDVPAAAKQYKDLDSQLDKVNDKLKQNRTDQSKLNEEVDKGNKSLDKNEKTLKNLEKQSGTTSNAITDLSDEAAKFYAQLNLSDEAALGFENLGESMKNNIKTMDSCMQDGKVINKKVYDDTKKNREKLVKEYVKKAKEYELSDDKIIKIAKKSGVELSKEELKQARESLKKAEQSKKDITKVKQQQNTELLSLLDKLGIDKDSKLGKQYQSELEKAQKNGTKSGEDYIKNMKKGISSGDISPDAQAQWNKGQKIFDNPLTALAKVMGASDAGKGAYGTLVSWIVKTFTGTVTTSGAGTAGLKAASDIKGKIKNLPGSINKTMGGLSSAWSYVKSWFSGKAVTVSVDFVAGKVAANIKGALKITTGWFADGGFPDVGQMFIAREAGPELVGTMGGRTAVANNDQITSGIYRAVLQALRDGGGFQERGGDLYITIQNEDGSKTTKIIKDYKKQMIFSGGKGGVPV